MLIVTMKVVVVVVPRLIQPKLELIHLVHYSSITPTNSFQDFSSGSVEIRQ